MGWARGVKDNHPIETGRIQSFSTIGRAPRLKGPQHVASRPDPDIQIKGLLPEFLTTNEMSVPKNGHALMFFFTWMVCHENVCEAVRSAFTQGEMDQE